MFRLSRSTKHHPEPKKWDLVEDFLLVKHENHSPRHNFPKKPKPVDLHARGPSSAANINSTPKANIQRHPDSDSSKTETRPPPHETATREYFDEAILCIDVESTYQWFRGIIKDLKLTDAKHVWQQIKDETLRKSDRDHLERAIVYIRKTAKKEWGWDDRSGRTPFRLTDFLPNHEGEYGALYKNYMAKYVPAEDRMVYQVQHGERGKREMFFVEYWYLEKREYTLEEDREEFEERKISEAPPTEGEIVKKEAEFEQEEQKLITLREKLESEINRLFPHVLPKKPELSHSGKKGEAIQPSHVPIGYR
ncbi:hypothetical protein BJ508DRAFT_378488 [Ascobolus immersus RN42]|uniref:Uncharacterized protein n=1 Tax=Ascobolus immersus RN42 TaxID=1160509 RepID=A0A3N4I018_ASCIM|nr:hypothetical protein BJ508DRAFT_378488 [Ascobolus immersus RN42]